MGYVLAALHHLRSVMSRVLYHIQFMSARILDAELPKSNHSPISCRFSTSQPINSDTRLTFTHGCTTVARHLNTRRFGRGTSSLARYLARTLAEDSRH